MKTSSNPYHAMDCRCSKCPGANRTARAPFRLTLGLYVLGMVIAGAALASATVAS